MEQTLLAGLTFASLFIYIALGIFVLIMFITMASKMCEVAEDKGYNSKENHIFAICFWFGLFGYLYVIALPDLKLHRLLHKSQNNDNPCANNTEAKIEEKKSHNPKLEAICKEIPGIEL